MVEQYVKQYAEAIFDTDRQQALEVVDRALEEGLPAEDVLFEIVLPTVESAMQAVSVQNQLSLAQRFMGAQIATELTELLLPRLTRRPPISGRVVIGTSAGDVHGLGKRIVAGCLRAHFIDVFDLGLNVAPERFVEEAVARQAHVIAISSMMLHTARSPRACLAVRRLLRERGLEPSIKIIVGGAPYILDPGLFKTVKADAWSPNATGASAAVIELLRQVPPLVSDAGSLFP